MLVVSVGGGVLLVALVRWSVMFVLEKLVVILIVVGCGSERRCWVRRRRLR